MTCSELGENTAESEDLADTGRIYIFKYSVTNALHKRKKKTVNLIHFLRNCIDFFLSKGKMKVSLRECFCNLEQVNRLNPASFSKKNYFHN